MKKCAKTVFWNILRIYDSRQKIYASLIELFRHELLIKLYHLRLQITTTTKIQGTIMQTTNRRGVIFPSATLICFYTTTFLCFWIFRIFDKFFYHCFSLCMRSFFFNSFCWLYFDIKSPLKVVESFRFSFYFKEITSQPSQFCLWLFNR